LNCGDGANFDEHDDFKSVHCRFDFLLSCPSSGVSGWWWFEAAPAVAVKVRGGEWAVVVAAAADGVDVVGGFAVRVRKFKGWVDVVAADPADVGVFEECFAVVEVGRVFGAACVFVRH
jgi:hypothetical protein